MKYITEFRDGKVAKKFAQQIGDQIKTNQNYRIMEFCGGHTHAIHRYGILALLPKNIEMIHGPGCPVCVLAIERLDQAIQLAQQRDVIFCSYADMLRIPASQQDSLFKAKARGADVRMIYSVDDALKIARKNPKHKIIFFAIGFETTTPPTAAAILQAHQEQLNNFFVFCNHVLTPVAMQAILTPQQNAYPANIDGFIGPAHVSTIIGSQPYMTIAQQYKKPIVISGFEPLDLLQSISMLIDLLNKKLNTVKNQFTRAVNPSGNLQAQELIKQAFSIRESFIWRGIGSIAHSALAINTKFAAYDAEKHFTLKKTNGEEHKACRCGYVLQGLEKPTSCKLFATACTPENPLGACMVSSEGACAAYYTYARNYCEN